MGKYGEQFYRGCRLSEMQDYDNAMACFRVASQNFKYHDDAIERMIRLNITTANYENARQLLEENYNKSSLNLDNVYGMLELEECNYQDSLKYFQLSLNDPNYQSKARMYIGINLYELGEYAMAEKVFNGLENNKEIRDYIRFQIMSLAILKGDYEKAYSFFQKIKGTNGKKFYEKSLRNIRWFLEAKLGIVSPENYGGGIYSLERLFRPDEIDLLVKHIAEHQVSSYKEAKYGFKNDVDLRTLVDVANREIQGMNPVHQWGKDVYFLTMPYMVGHNALGQTASVSIITALNDKNILTMYPVKLSSSFDKDNTINSTALALKRELK